MWLNLGLHTGSVFKETLQPWSKEVPFGYAAPCLSPETWDKNIFGNKGKETGRSDTTCAITGWFLFHDVQETAAVRNSSLKSLHWPCTAQTYWIGRSSHTYWNHFTHPDEPQDHPGWKGPPGSWTPTIRGIITSDSPFWINVSLTLWLLIGFDHV